MPRELEGEVQKTLDELDAKLLTADERLARIAKVIGEATQVSAGRSPGSARLRMLPMNLWDLLSRAGILMQHEGERPWLPLRQHGQGLQSLAVLFLFQASASLQVLEDAQEGVEPVFAIEEPEAHLHPQAARTLWKRVSSLPGQKVVTTHSPYFVQHVPLENLRIVRLNNGRTELSRMPHRVSSDIPWHADLEGLTRTHARMIARDAGTNCLAATQWFDADIADRLEGVLRGGPNTENLKARIAKFRRECRTLLSPDDELELTIVGRRLRGEIMFAKRWVLVEGASDFALVHAIAQGLGWPLDDHGVAVIDFQNNGSPGVYAALADAFGVPWTMVADGDEGGKDFRKQLLRRGFMESDINEKMSTLTPPNDLEAQLLADGHESLLRDILHNEGWTSARTCTREELLARLRKKKTEYATMLALVVAQDAPLASRMPKPFVDLILELKNNSA